MPSYDSGLENAHVQIEQSWPALILTGTVLDRQRSGVTAQDVDSLDTNQEDLEEALIRVLTCLGQRTGRRTSQTARLAHDKWNPVYEEISAGYHPPKSILRILLVDALRDYEAMV